MSSSWRKLWWSFSYITLLLLAGFLCRGAAAQSVSAGSGPLSELSNSVTRNSAPVRQGSLSVREGSAGSVTSGPVSESSRGSVLSGPVSEISRGPVRDAHSRARLGVPVTAGSAGAVTEDRPSVQGERIWDPLQELVSLREHLHARQAEISEMQQLETPLEGEDLQPEAEDVEDNREEHGNPP